MDTRPTTDRIKETLFNMISPYLYDCRFLDLFAGSGGIGMRRSAGSREAWICRTESESDGVYQRKSKKTKLENANLPWQRML